MSYRRHLMEGKKENYDDYFQTVMLEDGVINISIDSGLDVTSFEYIEYSRNNGQSWKKLSNINSQTVSITTPVISAGTSVIWRGLGYKLSGNNGTARVHIVPQGCFNIKGNILSLLYKNNFRGVTSMKLDPRYLTSHDTHVSIFLGLFDSTKVVDCSELILPLTTLRKKYYSKLFKNCTYLVNAGFTLLPSNIPSYGYAEMFYGCTALTTTPDIQAKTVDDYGMNAMFYGCTSLKVAPELHCTSYINMSCGGMFQGCTSLATVPYIEDASLTGAPFHFFTISCKKLNYVKFLVKNIDNSGKLNRWMDGQVPNVNTSVFVKHIDATWTFTGASGVLSNWKIIYYDSALDKYYLDQNRSTECDDHGNVIN